MSEYAEAGEFASAQEHGGVGQDGVLIWRVLVLRLPSQRDPVPTLLR